MTGDTLRLRPCPRLCLVETGRAPSVNEISQPSPRLETRRSNDLNTFPATKSNRSNDLNTFPATKSNRSNDLNTFSATKSNRSNDLNTFPAPKNNRSNDLNGFPELSIINSLNYLHHEHFKN
jgi:hypothetical protein